LVALLDVNVLVGLVDPEHIHHEAAHAWFLDSCESGWATCPLTENGLVRVVSSPNYPGRRTTVANAIALLATFCERTDHIFWPDSVTIRDPRFRLGRVQGYRQVTDVYLLRLAVENEGCLATFDSGISIDAVTGAKPTQLKVIATGFPP
jgi:uncharacterized protein